MRDSNKKTSTFVALIDIKLSEKLMRDLKEKGFEFTVPAYTVFMAKTKGISCTLYQSGKLMVQGKEMQPFIEFYLEPEILHAFSHTYKTIGLDKKARMGVDESGKGDFFGPLCVAGVFAQGEEIVKLQELGVCDSKKLTDASILRIGKAIKKDFIHHIVKINPKKYNELYSQFLNLNRMLAWGHATVIEKIAERTNCPKAIIDQFANENIVLTAVKRKKLEIELLQRHRAEEDLVVAAASILARMTFIEGIKELGIQYELELPKGASAKVIETGKALVRKYGPTVLPSVGKMHFKTSELILN